MKPLAILIASALGTGFIRMGSGTWGALVGLLYVWGLSEMEFSNYNLILEVSVVLITVIGYWAILFLKDTWKHDDSRITIDEVVGILVTMLFIPINNSSLILGFLLFRIFDIWKPLGIRKVDRWHSNRSVIADDILAGIYANIVTRIIVGILPWV